MVGSVQARTKKLSASPGRDLYHRPYTLCLRSWMETSHEALLQNLNVEQRYAEQHLKSLQPSAASLHRDILYRVQAEEVSIAARCNYVLGCVGVIMEGSTILKTCTKRHTTALCSYVGSHSREMGGIQLPYRAQQCINSTNVRPDRHSGQKASGLGPQHIPDTQWNCHRRTGQNLPRSDHARLHCGQWRRN